MDIRIPIIILIVLVATAIFVVILRANRTRDDRGRAAAAARGETVPARKFSPTIVYFVVGLGFVVVGLFEVLSR